jgi:UDP-glucuronate decarboxylase
MTWNYSGARVIVTGGAGFIGSHLCEILINMGSEVVCVDNYLTGRAANLSSLAYHPRFCSLDHDITSSFVSAGDAIFNLACPASPVWYQRDPVQTMRVNIIGALNLLELARQNNARILQASTSEVYGDPASHPQSESYWGNVNPIGVRACYNEGKRCSETLFFDYRRMHRVAIKVARIFNTYGPRMLPDDGRVVSTFIVQALRGEPITLFGDGKQTRSFAYVTDVVDAIVRLQATSNEVTGPINIGNPDEVTMRELAERILALTGSRSKTVFLPLPPDDPRQRQPDIALARSTLAWTPATRLDDGLRETVDYFRKIVGS